MANASLGSTQPDNEEDEKVGPLNRLSHLTEGKYGLLLVIFIYFLISVLFLLGLLLSSGDAAQQDWSIPITNSAAQNNLNSLLYVWQYNGFGGISVGRWGFPYFTIINAVFAPLGFVGGAEIKLLAVVLVALGGISSYLLARSLGLRFFSSFIVGLFFMTTPIMFDWLMFGWFYYIIAYDLLPIIILVTKRYLETKQIRYALIAGLILSIAMSTPATLLIYPTLMLVFVLFESKKDKKVMIRGLVCILVSVFIWMITSLSFFVSYLNTISFYQGNFFNVIVAQFHHFSNIANVIRLWGSTFNYQFETYYPGILIIFSFVPIIIAMIEVAIRHRDRRILFALAAYSFVFLSYIAYANLHFLVYDIPFGSIFIGLSILLVPGALGLALLIGYAIEDIPGAVSKSLSRLGKSIRRSTVNKIISLIVLLLVVLAGLSWWTGQTSGWTYSGPPTKLNLYSTPSSYTEWADAVSANDSYLALYVPYSGNAQVSNSTYFSGSFEGVNGGIFTQVNGLPYVSQTETNTLLNDLVNNNSQVGPKWGSYSIKYIVIYTNIETSYNLSLIISRLSTEQGLVKTYDHDDVIVFENTNASPIVYTSNQNLTMNISYHDPTDYVMSANSTTSSFFLVLNQAYSSDWTVSINGIDVPVDHIQTDNGCNGWYINETGKMTIAISYSVQPTYLLSFTVSAISVVVVLSLILVMSVMVYRNKKGK